MVAPLVPMPDVGRRFHATRAVRLGDVDPSGRLRFDAIARYLQDVASDDAYEVMGDDAFGWVVRRTTIEVTTFPVLNEPVTATTWGSGVGTRWAERRTSVAGDLGGRVEAASLWVRVDPVTGRPKRLDPPFLEAYAEAVGGRTVSSRLEHPDPLVHPEPEAAATAVRTLPWTVRRCDLDVFGHVNNALAWAAFEEVIALDDGLPLPAVVEVEYRGGLDLSMSSSILVEGTTAWIMGDGLVTASIVVA